MGIIIIIGILPGKTIFTALQLPKIIGLLTIIFLSIRKSPFEFFANLLRSPGLPLLGIIFLQIIIDNNYRGFSGTNNIYDGLNFWLIIITLHSSLQILSLYQKSQLREGIILGCIIISILIFYHAITTIEIQGFTLYHHGYLMYGWSDHLSIVLLCGIWLSNKSWQKLLFLICISLIFAKTSIVLGLLSFFDKRYWKNVLILSTILIIFMFYYQTFLLENNTLFNGIGDRLSKPEAVSKKYKNKIPMYLLNIYKDKKNYRGISTVEINKKIINYYKIFYQPIINQIEKDNRTILGKISNGRLVLWKYQIRKFNQEINRNPIKILIGNGSQGFKNDNIIWQKMPVKAHLLPLDILFSHGLLGLFSYILIAIPFFGLWGNIAILTWYHCIEYSPLLLITYSLLGHNESILININYIFRIFICRSTFCC